MGRIAAELVTGAPLHQLHSRASAAERVEVAALGELSKLLGDVAGEHRAAGPSGNASAAAAAIGEPPTAPGRVEVAGEL